ncbi:teneurin-2 isoform X3, partial [Tachysurus ichikawai]
PSSHHSQTAPRPPLPPAHNHHQTSANSLNCSGHGSRRAPQSHVPTAAPADGPSTPESVQLQESWALNSSVPLETRSGSVSHLCIIITCLYSPSRVTFMICSLLTRSYLCCFNTQSSYFAPNFYFTYLEK